MHVVETFPKFDHRLRSLNVIVDCNASDSDGHEDQAQSENRIYLADNFIDRKKCSKEVIDKYYDCENLRPFGSIEAHSRCSSTARAYCTACTLSHHEGKQSGRTYHEDNADHNEKHNAEQSHDLKHEASEIFSGDFRDARAVIPY